jgi:hypothetical protein
MDQESKKLFFGDSLIQSPQNKQTRYPNNLKKRNLFQMEIDHRLANNSLEIKEL